MLHRIFWREEQGLIGFSQNRYTVLAGILKLFPLVFLRDTDILHGRHIIYHLLFLGTLTSTFDS
jgi:hypothetical protein